LPCEKLKRTTSTPAASMRPEDEPVTGGGAERGDDLVLRSIWLLLVRLHRAAACRGELPQEAYRRRLSGGPLLQDVDGRQGLALEELEERAPPVEM
jgi:hypothetical protein